MIILITGSSASGKTTIARALAEQYQFRHIDGDQVIKDLGLTSKAWNTIHDNIIDRALQFDFDANVVISHVVMPDKFSWYAKKFCDNNIGFTIIVLKPNKRTLLKRNIARTCHPKPTPVNVIDYFYQKFLEINSNARKWFIIDSSQQDSAETVRQIVDYCGISTVKL